MRLRGLKPLIKTLEKEYAIAPSSKVVIDARSYYKNTYRDSGCEYILGGEYDRYADYLRKLFKNFQDIDVTCYVIFNGAAAASDLDRRHNKHQKIIDKTNSIDPAKPNNVFSEPIFAKDVFKEVLNELGIRYAVCECDDVVEMVNLARSYDCPLITRSVEYSVFGVTCISPKSLLFNAKSISCRMYDPGICRKRISLGFEKLAIFIVLLNECNDYLQDLNRLIMFNENNMINKVHRYIHRQTIDTLLSEIRKEMSKRRYKMFLNDYNMTKAFMNHNQDSLIQLHLQKSDAVLGLASAAPTREMRFRKLYPLIETLQKDHTIAANSNLVVDARSFCLNAYNGKGCSDYDSNSRYADRLRKIFKTLQDLNVTCYVFFNGMAEASDMESHSEIPQEIVDQTNINPTKPNNEAADFTESAFKKILKELGIRYAICDYDYVVEMVNVARYHCCPLLTRSVEYSLFGVPCISPDSLVFDTRCIHCKIYEEDICKERIGLRQDKLSIFMVLMSDCNGYLRVYEPLTSCEVVYHCLRRETRDALLSNLAEAMNESMYEMFLNEYNTVRNLMFRRQSSLIYKFQTGPVGTEYWFVKGVITDRIPICYLNLKNGGTFSGSWLISDMSKKDPMLPSMNIIRLAFELLNDFRGAKITFLGRVGTQSKAWDIFDSVDFKRAEGTLGDVFEDGWSADQLPDYFSYFFQVELPGFDFDTLKLISADCRVLIMALVYYSAKIDGDKLALVYSVLLSYTMLGPVARTTGLLKRTNLRKKKFIDSDATTVDGLVEGDCFAAAKALISYFYCSNLVEIFDREILHMFAEFQHCLQQLNYLNRLCGERMQRTVYYRCYNATFIYNLYFEMRQLTEPMEKIDRMLRKSPSVLEYFKRLVGIFECCVESLTRT